MEALVLALRLGMVRPAMADPDAMAQQPDRERGVRLSAAVAPRRAVVHQHRTRQAVAAKQRGQAIANRAVLLVAARLDAQRITRVIVEHRQRMAAPAGHREMTLEIHLPQLVGFGALEANMRPGMLRAAIELAVAAQDIADRACCRHRPAARLAHRPGDLAAAPGVVARRPDPQHLGFHSRLGSRRAGVRPARAIRQPARALRLVTLQPLVARAHDRSRNAGTDRSHSPRAPAQARQTPPATPSQTPPATA